MATVVELGQKMKAKFPGVYDDLPDDELGRKVKAKYPGAYDDFTEAPSFRERLKSMPPEDPWWLNPEGAKVYRSLGSPDVGKMALEALPTAGGFIGGAAGTVLGIPAGPPGMVAGGIGGAALGGGAGEIIRRGIQNEPMDPRAILTQGATEGAFQAAGGALAKGAAKASPFLARRALSLARRRGGGLMDTVLGGAIGSMGGHMVPGAIAGKVVGAAAKSPAVNAGLAKLLASPKFQRAARQSPRAAAAMVQQILLSAEPDATAP